MKSLAAWPAGAVQLTTIVPPAVAVAGAETEYVLVETTAPEPDSAALTGLALLATASVAARVPAAAGLKVTVIVQLAPAASDVPQVVDCVKSVAFAPEMAMAIPVS